MKGRAELPLRLKSIKLFSKTATHADGKRVTLSPVPLPFRMGEGRGEGYAFSHSSSVGGAAAPPYPILLFSRLLRLHFAKSDRPYRQTRRDALRKSMIVRRQARLAERVSPENKIYEDLLVSDPVLSFNFQRNGGAEGCGAATLYQRCKGHQHLRHRSRPQIPAHN